MAIDKDYLNSPSVEQIRSELEYALNVQYGLLHALRDAPEMPSGFVLMHLGTAAKWPEDNDRGKELQRKLGTGVIPPKSECEGGAGLWAKIRPVLLATAQ